MVYDKREALLPQPYPKSPLVPPGIQHGHSMIIIRLFTVPYFSVRLSRLMAAILIFSCTESNLGMTIKST